MRFSGLHHRHTPRHTASGLCVRARAWVGLLLALLLLSTLAPVISRTRDHGKPLAERGWVEVCSAHGLSWVRADDGSGAEPASGDLLKHLDSCGYCALATDRGTPPPSFDGWGLAPSALPPCPTWAGHTFPTAPTHTPQARGPPVSF
jgi:hypothetical protein